MNRLEKEKVPAAVPSVCVGMPVYNSERFVGPAIESVLSQSWSDFELVISDNASTDNTYSICENYRRKDSRIRLLRQPRNLGAPANYRAVAAESRSPYFKWASGSDVIHQEFLAACIVTLETRPDCVLVYPRTRLFLSEPEDGEDYEDGLDLQMDDPVRRMQAVHERLRLNNVLNGVMRWAAIRSVGYMPDFIGGDVMAVAELALAGKFIELPTPMLFRRMDTFSATRLQSYEQILRHFYPNESRRQLFQNWKRCLFGARGAFRQNLSAHDRTRVLVYVARTCRWSLPKLYDDLRVAFRYLTG